VLFCVVFTLVISFVSKGFPYKDKTDKSFIVVVYCIYSPHVTLSTFLLISLFQLQHTYQRHNIAYCAESAIKHQSVNQSIIGQLTNTATDGSLIELPLGGPPIMPLSCVALQAFWLAAMTGF